MYAKGSHLTREQYLGGVGRTADTRVRGRQQAKEEYWTILSENNRVQEVEVRRVVRDIVLLYLNPSVAGHP